MKNLHFTQDQIKKILLDVAKEEGGLMQIFKLSLETLMKAEREFHNQAYGDVSNGFRYRKTYGQGKIMELRVPRSRYGQFYPVLLGVLRDQEEECRRLAFGLYGAGLTTEQVGKLFGEIYGRTYSSSQISRMFEYVRKEVQVWLERKLDAYYPIILIDGTFIATRRADSVSKECYYTVLGVKADRTREVLSIVNMPTESASGWESVLEDIFLRGVKEVGLFISDGINGIEDVIGKYYPKAKLQLCTVHLERNIQKHVRPKDKAQVTEEFRKIFRTGDSGYTKAGAMRDWQAFVRKWEKHYPVLSRIGKGHRMEWYFTYLEYDWRIQSMIYTTNWIERLNRDYKRTTRMRGALPDVRSAILLLGYVAMTRTAYQRKIPKLNYENHLFRWDESDDE